MAAPPIRSKFVGKVAWKSDPSRDALRALYADIDKLLEPFSCNSSTDCCRFGVTGREPYPTSVEMAEVLDAASKVGTSGREKTKRKLHVVKGHASHDASQEKDERRCPLLSEDGRCRIYASRPFGCRTFFCERMSGPSKLPRTEILRISRAIADLSARFDPRDPLPRPLSRALEQSRAHR